MQGRRFYLDHMIRLGVPLDREWTGDVGGFCEVDGVVYPHLILACVSKYKGSQLIEYETQCMYDNLTKIESPTVFDRELADMQEELTGWVTELEHSDLKGSRRQKQNCFSMSRCDEICDKLRDGGVLTETDYQYIRRNAWAFKWTFRGTPEQEERALGVRFTCCEAGSEE